MKLASLQGGRDGQLILVSRDLRRAVSTGPLGVPGTITSAGTLPNPVTVVCTPCPCMAWPLFGGTG